MQKSFNLLLVLLLIFSSAPNITFAEEEEIIEEHKLYAETEDEKIQVFEDKILEEELYELEDDTSVLVNKTDLETSIKEESDYIYVTLNPEVEEIPKELEGTFKEINEIRGFVHIDYLVDLEDEAEFILERKTEKENSEEDTTNDPDETKEEPSEEDIEEKTLEESETEVEEELNEEQVEDESDESDETETEELEEKEETTEERTTLSMKSNVKESSTSRLGHIRGGKRLIYETIGGKSESSLKYTDAVYYIKREAKLGSETYYLLSTEPSAKKGAIGWMRARDLSTHTHVGVTKDSQQLTIKGTGKATSKAWGGSKDTIHKSLSNYKSETLHVNLTEKVGKNTWYRGKINGKGSNLWLHSSQTEKLQIKESNTSRLGHIRGGKRLIYETIGGKSESSLKYTDAVYYIKREAKLGSETYYLLSTEPSAKKGAIGWMKAADVSTHNHTGVTNKSKQLLIKGTGKATSKAWGGSRDKVDGSMTRFKGNTLYVNLTEKVGKNTWYRGKINNAGTNIWLHSSQTETKPDIKETGTSKLGHIRGGNRLIYETVGGKSIKASAKHRDAVYYIKRQAKLGVETYYLLSTSPSATRGDIGWMKAKDVSTHTHKTITKKSEKLMITGSGKGTKKAWGGSKDTIYASMKSFQGEFFNINLTEKVGKNTWYRGKINGQGANVWLHSSQTERFQVKEANTSRLGHIRGGNRLIYDEIGGKSIKASAKHRDAVYYIKRQAKVGSQTYYLLSTEPSAKKGVIGWMKATDVSTHTHVGVTKNKREFLIKGTGKATSKAWGGSKDTVHKSMNGFKAQVFHVNLSEKVGKNTWYRGKIKNSGGNIWLHSSDLSGEIVNKTNYGLSLNEALEIQNKPERSPFVLNGSHGFIAKSRVNKNNRLKKSTYVRTMPQTGANLNNKIIKTLDKDTKITPIKGGNDNWYAIEVGGSRQATALSHQIKERLNPKSTIKHPVNKFQFLDLRERTGLTSGEMNRELATRGILKNQGKAFRDASIKHGINEMYLIVHARLETGNGTSPLSKGTHKVGLDNKGKPQLVKTASDRVRLKKIKKTYNMFGIGAIDTAPAAGGAIRAYKEGWFTPEAAIVGGAAWIKKNYIYNKHNQNTLYKMRWNPNMADGFAWKQYATDIDWALKQARLIHGVYNKTDKSKILTFDTPTYK